MTCKQGNKIDCRPDTAKRFEEKDCGKIFIQTLTKVCLLSVTKYASLKVPYPNHYQYIQDLHLKPPLALELNSLVVSVNLLRTNIAILSRALGVASSDSLTINIANTKPSQLILLINNSDNSKSRSRVSNITPRNSEIAISTLLSRERLVGGIDDSAVFGFAVGYNVEVVVAGVAVFAAVAVHIVQSPGLAGDFLGVGAGCCGGVGGGCLCGDGGRGGLDG
jgi:hypothetical protein